MLRGQDLDGEVVVSYDTRLLSEKFAREAVEVLPTTASGRCSPIGTCRPSVSPTPPAIGMPSSA